MGSIPSSVSRLVQNNDIRFGLREFNFEVQFPIKNQAAFQKFVKTTCIA